MRKVEKRASSSEAWSTPSGAGLDEIAVLLPLPSAGTTALSQSACSNYSLVERQQRRGVRRERQRERERRRERETKEGEER